MLEDREAGILEKSFAALVILISTGAPIPIILEIIGQGSNGGTESNPVTFAAWILFYVIAVVLSLPRLTRLFTTAMQDHFILSLIFLAIASTMWSTSPEVTLKRSFAVLGTCLVGWYLGSRFRPGEIIRLVVLALGTAAAASILLATLTPWGVVTQELGMEVDVNYLGAWRGIYPTKNLFAQVMVLSTVAFVFIAFDARHRFLLLLGAAVSAVLVLLAHSATSLLVLLILLVGVLPASTILWQRPTVIVSLALLGAMAGCTLVLLMTSQLPNVLELLGRDPTLTGRLELWNASIEMIGHYPWFGWGHGAFWLDWEGRGSSQVLQKVGWNAGYAHNGFLDQALGLGIVGTMLLVLAIVSATALAVSWGRLTMSVQGLFPVVLVAFLILANLTEGGLFQQNNYMLLIFVAVSSSIRNEFQTWGPRSLDHSPLPLSNSVFRGKLFSKNSAPHL